MSSKPLRVLMISKACVVGTYQRKLEEIAAYPDIELTVIVPPAWKDARGLLVLERIHTEGYQLLAEPVGFNGSFHFHYYPTLARRMRQFQPDILHIDEEPYNLATYHAMHLGRRANAHTLFFSWQNIQRRYPPPFAWMEEWVINHADAGIVGSKGARQVWRAKGYQGPLVVIPQFGVDPDLFAPAPNAAEAPLFRIGYAGRLVPEKGLDVLLKAVGMLQSGNWHLTILGDGPLRHELPTLAGLLNLGGSVDFQRPRPSTEMVAFYHNLDVLVLPSLTRPNWKEQFGRVLIEAMACGVPVVGSDSGAIPEVIGEAGLIVPEGDKVALRDALQRIMWDIGEQRRLAEAGRAHVIPQFTQKQVAADTVALYRQIARR